MRLQATALAVCLCFLSAAGEAQAPAARGQRRSPRTAVLIGRTEPELLKRIRGQTGDLGWKLVVEESAGQPDMRQAQEVGARLGARAVIWLETPAGGGLTVKIAQVGHDRLFTRRIDPPGAEEVHAHSAMAEAAALVVRSSLMSLASGTPLGQPVEADSGKPMTKEREAKKTPSARPGAGETRNGRTTPEARKAERTETEEAEGEQAEAGETEGDDTSAERAGYEIQSDDRTEPAATIVEPGTIEEPGEPSAAGLRTSIGWQVAADGQSPAGQHALGLRLALELGRFELGLLGSMGLVSARLDDDSGQFAVRLNRHAVLGGLGYALLSSEELRLSFGAAAGMIIFYRRTEVYADDLEPAPPARRNAVVFRGGLLGQWLPRWTDRVLGLELEIAADVAPAAPVFSVREPERVADSKKLWPVQLVAMLGLVARYGI
jgi:hypothetical protein